MIGLDTGFFVKLAQLNTRAQDIWEEIVEGNLKACVNVLTFFELKKLSLKGVLDKDVYVSLEEALGIVCEILEVDSELAIEAASLSHGLGLATVDAIIFESFRKRPCREVYITDSRWQVYQGREPKAVILS